MKKHLIILITALSLLAGTAWADTLGSAKNSGLVGETSSGYLEAVKTPDDATRKLIKSINKKRKAEYKKIAQDNATSLQAVESMAGEKTMRMTAKGNYIKKSGKWIKK